MNIPLGHGRHRQAERSAQVDIHRLRSQVCVEGDASEQGSVAAQRRSERHAVGRVAVEAELSTREGVGVCKKRKRSQKQRNKETKP